MIDLRKNLFNTRRPYEWLGLAVVCFEILVDRLHQFFDAEKAAAPNPLLRELTQPTFDQIQPRRARRNEMEMEAPMASEPTLHLGVLVRAVVVHDQMKVQVKRKLSIEAAEKL